MTGIVRSPIAIDLGGKYTGIHLSHFSSEATPADGNIKGLLVEIPEKGIVWSQKGRTLRRHQLRAGKRRKMAKRLLHIILGNQYPVFYMSAPF